MSQPNQSVPRSGTFYFSPDAGTLQSATLWLSGGLLEAGPLPAAVAAGQASWSLAGYADGYYGAYVEYTTDRGSFTFSLLLTLGTPAVLGAPDYTAWPVAADVEALLAASGVTLRIADTAGAVNRKLAEVIAEVSRRTLRQFLTTTEARVFDGNGTPEMEIDEAVSVTSVAVIGIQSDPGYAISGFQLVSEQNKPRTRLVTARGSVPAYTSAGVYLPYHWVFPAGRQNISVTATWGYAATIPADLWGAVCDEAAYRLAAELCFRPTGRVLEQRASDGSLTHFALDAPAVTQWHARYQKAIQDFKRPAGRRLRRLRGTMI